MRTLPFPHRTVAWSLIACGVLMLVSVVFMPAFDGGTGDRLQNIAAAGTTGALSAHLFALAQVPFAVGMVGVCLLLATRARRLSAVAATMALLGAFGHSVYAGVSLTMLDMASQPEHYETFGALLDTGEAGTLVPYLVMGVLGTVLAIVLTAVALWRTRMSPRWLPLLLIWFVVVEFGGSALGRWAGYAAGVLFLGAMIGLARAVNGVSTPTRAEAAGARSLLGSGQVLRRTSRKPS